MNTQTLVIRNMNTPIEIVKDAKFRKGFCLKPGFRFEHLRPYCRELVFATDGYKTDVLDIKFQLELAFDSFDPNQDVIIPTGNGITNLLTGYLLCEKFGEHPISVAFFQKAEMKFNRVTKPESYVFYRINLPNLF
jgi:hypothetical protein